MPWIVAATKPNSEALAILNLDRQGFESYCPRILQKRPNKPPLIRPLFPGYMFVKINLQWYSIRNTRGIRQVLLGDAGPSIIADIVIEELKAREGRDGLVTLEPKDKFAKGTTVKAIKGPFQGHLMIYEGMVSQDRVRVLLDLLGRKCVVEVQDKNIVAA